MHELADAALMLLADGSVPDPTGIVDAAASGNAVKFSGALALGAIVLLGVMIRAHLTLIGKRETDLTDQRKTYEEMLKGKDVIIAGKDGEILGIAKAHAAEKDQMRLSHIADLNKAQKMARRMLKMEEEETV